MLSMYHSSYISPAQILISTDAINNLIDEDTGPFMLNSYLLFFNDSPKRSQNYSQVSLIYTSFIMDEILFLTFFDPKEFPFLIL